MRWLVILALALPALISNAADTQAAPVVTYQMDLFSIISFALAIAAFIVSIFLGWLSWEFYKKSAEASEKSQQAVTKIETAVLNIQSEITEIVRRAVGYWTGGETDPQASEAAILAKRVDELSEEIKAVSGNSTNKQELEEKLAELVRLQRDQIASLSASISETKARAIFPSIGDRGPVAEVTNSVEKNTEAEAAGKLIISVLRPSKVVTVTGRFDAPFSRAATLNVNLLDAPDMMKHITRLTSGIGRGSEFNVHLNSSGGLLTTGMVEPGTYVVSYTATSDRHSA